MSNINDVLHAEARSHAEKLRVAGKILDKKRLRFNDAVEVGVFYGRCGKTFCLTAALAGVREAVDACMKDDQSETEGPLTAMIQHWMMACPDPRSEVAK